MASSSQCGFRFQFGKYQDESLLDIPTNYLIWAFENCDSLNSRDRTALLTEIRQRREYEGPQHSSAPSPVAVDAAIGLEIIKLGRRELAKRYHPDKGGDAEKMTRANATADFLEKRLTLLLEAGA